MPFGHLIDHERHLVVVKGSGEGTLEEISDSARRLFEDQSIGTDFRLIILVDDVSADPTPEEVPVIVTLIECVRTRITGRMAIVTSRPGRVTTAVLIAFAADGDSVRHFDSESEARNWLLGIAAAA